MSKLNSPYRKNSFYTLKTGFVIGIFEKLRFLLKVCISCLFLLTASLELSAQTCNVITSAPATPPSSGAFASLQSATDYEYYSLDGSRIYDTYDTTGAGAYIQIDTAITFWKLTLTGTNTGPGPMNRCGVWSASNPLRLGFSVCVDIPESKTYYMGFGADNSGTLIVDGDTLLQNIGFNYWGIYKYNFTKGKHLIGFSNINFGGEAAIGFEIYNNTAAQIAAATNYGALNLVYSTHQEIGALVEEGDPDNSYSCPLGSILDYCASSIPVCSQFVPISLRLNNPAPACLSAGVDLTDSTVTAGNPTSLAYTYWQDSLATIPLASPQKVTKSGTYYIEGTFNQCNLIKPVTVVVNSANTIISKELCPGQNYLGYTKAGSFTDTLKAKDGCDSLVTINITVSPKASLGPNRTLCSGDTILLSPGYYAQYHWQDNSTNPQYTVTAPGTYSVSVTDTSGCVSADTVIISPGNCTTKIPNTFTPNGDGINDTWQINLLQSYPQCTVFIYNRWGQQVFTSTGYAKPWDGLYGGKPVSSGVYYYVINLTGSGPTLSGFVAVIR